LVTAVGDELLEFAVRHKARRYHKIIDIDSMTGEFIVETKTVAIETDLVAAGFDLDLARYVGFGVLFGSKSIAICRIKRIHPEREFKIGDEKFLMLLFMIEPKLD